MPIVLPRKNHHERQDFFNHKDTKCTKKNKNNLCGLCVVKFGHGQSRARINRCKISKGFTENRCQQILYPLAAFIRWPRFRLISFLLCLAILVTMPAQPAHAQDPCKTALEEAEDEYDFDRFARAIALLEQCLKLTDGFKDEVLRLRAYKITALSYISLDDSSHARETVNKILDLRPDYNPRLDPDSDQDPAMFARLVNETKEKRRRDAINSERWNRRKRVMFIGGGALLVGGGTLAYFLLTKEDQPLPRPPDIRDLR
jgi:tetratricopeptide (TPR) repeat protein